jgi:archaellum biogenesis ATPase FlaH
MSIESIDIYYWAGLLIGLLGTFTGIFIALAIYRTKQGTFSKTKTPSYSPFFYGNPVSPDQFVGRQKEVRRLAGRIVSGQSSAITGTFRSGKTSMLKYLMAPEKQIELYGDIADSLIFSNLDANTLKTKCDQSEFWERILEPFQQRIHTEAANSSLAQAYQLCQENAFENRVLEKLIAQIKHINWQLVLMIDEFDALLARPHLNNTEFFGGLRGLVSQSDGALILVITINTSLTQLHQKTKPLSKSGSPYFNFFDEIILGTLSDSEVEKLLEQDDSYFSDDDRRFIKEITGEHPYLLQVAASALWESYQNGNEEDPIKRQEQAKQDFYDRTKATLNDIWQSWLPTTRKAFIAVALIRLETLRTSLKIQPIDIKGFINDEPGFKQALEELKKQGFVKDENGDWRVRPTIFLDFVADQPVQAVQELCKLFEKNYHSTQSSNQ